MSTARGQQLREGVSAAIRSIRTSQQMSLSELARRSGVSKGAISQLENGAVSPNLETLWAISDALRVPFSALVQQAGPEARLIRNAEAAAVRTEDADYSAALLSASPPGARRDIFLVRASAGTVRVSEPHQAGTVEHIMVVSGEVEAGPVDAAVDLHPGDYLSYRGDATHVFRTDGDAVAILISELR